MVQDKKRAAIRERSNRGISRRIKMQKSDPGAASSTAAMFPAYERVVLREGKFMRFFFLYYCGVVFYEIETYRKFSFNDTNLW